MLKPIGLMQLLTFSFLLSGCSNLKTFGNEIKDWFSGPTYIKIQGEDANEDLNQAIFYANRRAIKKVQEMGCETQIGSSETFYRKSGKGWVATSIYRVQEKKCLQIEFATCTEEWVKETSRSQGGGWIWYPGVGTNISLSRAILSAEGTALNYLYGECQSVPMDTKFNERCIEKYNGNYKVHVRASIKQSACNVNTKSNKELVTRLLSYRATEAKRSLDTHKCNENEPEGCFLLANKEMKQKNYEASLAYSEAGCMYKDYYSCGFLGFLHMELGNVHDARRFLKLGCDFDKRDIWCENLKKLEDQLGKI